MVALTAEPAAAAYVRLFPIAGTCNSRTTGLPCREDFVSWYKIDDLDIVRPITTPAFLKCKPHTTMAWLYTSALTCVALSIAVSGQHTWPNPKLDELESLLYDQFGYNNNGIVAGALRPCTLFNFGDTPGRSNAADWIRTVRPLHRVYLCSR